MSILVFLGWCLKPCLTLPGPAFQSCSGVGALVSVLMPEALVLRASAKSVSTCAEGVDRAKVAVASAKGSPC